VILGNRRIHRFIDVATSEKQSAGAYATLAIAVVMLANNQRRNYLLEMAV
jgi:hypothetical protein